MAVDPPAPLTIRNPESRPGDALKPVEPIELKRTWGFGFAMFPERPDAGWIIIFCISALIACALIQRRFGPFGLLIFLVVLCFGMGSWQFRKIRNYKLVDVPAGQIETTRHTSRLKVTGTRRELSQFLSIDDVLFEPIIVQQAMRPVSMVASVVLVLSAFAAFIIWCSPLVMSIGAVLGFALAQLVVLVPLAIEQILPVYYRIAPGRMDVLKFSTISQKGKLVESYDLRSVRITILCNKRRIDIEEPGRASVRIPLYCFLKPYEFARGILQGAVSTHPAPPLPDDELLG
ncbi:hypothetical protein B7486_08820 [cyanobacterium TDX16]|nr:hypothetical protein B7486_08820 [cyanobacterium TDX16]